uniref:Uncharacterized protein n=1 Tax=Ditylenchus dipsaci TaxID=166011 RepID=A0A915EKK2_9BILA
MYSYLQQQLIIPWLLVTIYLNDFLSADPQPQQQQPAMITHHPLEDFNKHLLFLSGLHHVHPLVLPHPLLAGPQTLPVHHPGLPHLPPPFQLPTALMQQPALSPMLENILVVTASPSQTGTLIKTQEQVSDLLAVSIVGVNIVDPEHFLRVNKSVDPKC